MFCKHNYVFTQGHFYCTKCHHKTHKEKYGKRRGRRKVIGIAGVIIAGIIGVMFVSGTLQINQENLNESIKFLPANLQESIKSVSENLSSNIPEISSVTTQKSKLIGTSQTWDQIEFTVVDIRYSDSGHVPVRETGGKTTEKHASKYTTFMVVELKVVNLSKQDNNFGMESFVLYDQHSTAYHGFGKFWNPLKPSIPQSMLVYFEIPKDDSFVYTLYLHAVVFGQV